MEKQISEDMFLYTNDLAPSDYVIINSETFGEHGGYVQGIFGVRRMSGVVGYVPLVTVSMELPDDHSSVKDASGDYPGMSTDQMEFIDIVPASCLERPDGRKIRFWTRPITDAERAARARRRGQERLALPELDEGLRR